MDDDDDKPRMVPIGEHIVGTLLHAGIIKPEDGARAEKIIKEEIGVWLAVKKFND